MSTSAITRQSVKEKETAIFNWKLRKGVINLSYVGGQVLFTEQRYFGDIVTNRATDKTCDCQKARNGYVCQHIKYLREGNNMLDMSVEF